MYNISYLIAGFIFLSVMFVHFLNYDRNPNSTESRVLLYFFTIGELDLLLDILTTCMIAGRFHYRPEVLAFALTVFYFLQAIFPVSLYVYAVSLRDDASLKDILLRHFLCLIPCLAILGMIFNNIWTGLLFHVTRSGAYVHGSCYLATYLQALFYVILIALDTLIHRSEYGRTAFTVLWEYLLIMSGCVLVQARYNQLLVTGFGIALGISVFFYTLNNPHEVSDRLTGTFDHQYFRSWTGKLKKRGKTFHLLSVEMCQLREHNTLFGSEIADQMLVDVADQMRRLCPRDYLFRVKGSRLVVVTESLHSYETVLNAMEQTFHQPFQINGEPYLFPAILCGIIHAERLESSEALLHYIDYLVSVVPNHSETTLIQGNDQTLRNFLYEREVERFLPIAIQEDLFELNYQPIFSLEWNAFVTLEALSRLKHPSLGMISPELFISIAERRGWVVEIGTLQFRRLCKFIKDHPELQEILYSVKFNLSPAELLKQGHCQTLIDIIESYGLPYDFFQFEVTETVATQYSDILYKEIALLSKKGIKLNLDDFGSGYANLNTVLRLPISSVKLDRSLLFHILDNRNAARFYQNIVSILHNMGYLVVSEGLEKQEELDLITRWGVDLIQGYYFSKPLSGEALLEFLHNENKED